MDRLLKGCEVWSGEEIAQVLGRWTGGRKGRWTVNIPRLLLDCALPVCVVLTGRGGSSHFLESISCYVWNCPSQNACLPPCLPAIAWWQDLSHPLSCLLTFSVSLPCEQTGDYRCVDNNPSPKKPNEVQGEETAGKFISLGDVLWPAV